jgi:hypothetical protein
VSKKKLYPPKKAREQIKPPHVDEIIVICVAVFLI